MLKYLVLFLGLFSFYTKAQNSFLESKFNSDFYKNQWVGFYLYDPVEKKELYNYQGEKYFIPASNTKIFALYTGLKMLPDSIPSLKYLIKDEVIYIMGTGDPTLLESYFKERKVIDFLQNRKEKIALFLSNYEDTKYGPGWSWEDYAEDFSPEKGIFPIYGNIATISTSYKVNPIYFRENIRKEKSDFPRKLTQNTFYSLGKKKLTVPFITSDTLTKKLLELEINKPITLVDKFPKGNTTTLYSIPVDSLFRRMMLVSDNFLAEQILLMGSSVIFEKISSKSVITYMLSKHLKGLPQEPRWVDGSGLSRYNNFSPQDFVFVLNKMHQEIPFNRLENLFPIGGISGTLKNSYKGNPPYIFAKTGSMGQVYNLSGYIKTISGKILIFSFMNNNFNHSNAAIKTQIQEVLEYIRDTY